MELMRELWAYLDELYGNSETTSFELAGMEDPRAAFVIAREAGAAVGCAALCPMSDGIAEVKRMYVRPEMRCKGVGRQLITTLERIAKDGGFRQIWLQTGLPQVAAIKLYEQLGYKTISPYGEYKEEPDCVCYAKLL